MPKQKAFSRYIIWLWRDGANKTFLPKRLEWLRPVPPIQMVYKATLRNTISVVAYNKIFRYSILRKNVLSHLKFNQLFSTDEQLHFFFLICPQKDEKNTMFQLCKKLLLPALQSSMMDRENYFVLAWDKLLGDMKSVNLKYNTLVRWADGKNVSLTKHLMFHFIKSCKTNSVVIVNKLAPL